MDRHTFAGDRSQGENERLAQWLQHLLQSSTDQPVDKGQVAQTEEQLELLLANDYHPHFYQQLPDFILQLLKDSEQATVQYAPLLFHLAMCRSCHAAYLELYDALSVAVQPRTPRPQIGQGTRTLSATPPRMLAHLCQSFISQAEAALRQARHDHSDQDAAARSLLQLALHVSSHIVQSSVRRQALQSLVRVATLFDGPAAPGVPDGPAQTYTPVTAGAGGARRGTRTIDVRSAEIEQPFIPLQSRVLEGSIRQQGEMLELHLSGLGEALRGKHVAVSVLLGSLLEPIRWIGGDPRSIRSAQPVDSNGALMIPLGLSSLQLGKAEERNLLEAIFAHVEVRPLA